MTEKKKRKKSSAGSPSEPGAFSAAPAAPVKTAAENEAVERLLRGTHHDPHSILGAHPATHEGEPGVVVRVMHHAATRTELLLPDGEPREMPRVLGGLFAVFLPYAE